MNVFAGKPHQCVLVKHTLCGVESVIVFVRLPECWYFVNLCYMSLRS